MKLPAPPMIRMMAAKADAEWNMYHRFSALELIDLHIMQVRASGLDFAPWTPEGEAAFLNHRAVA